MDFEFDYNGKKPKDEDDNDVRDELQEVDREVDEIKTIEGGGEINLVDLDSSLGVKDDSLRSIWRPIKFIEEHIIKSDQPVDVKANLAKIYFGLLECFMRDLMGNDKIIKVIKSQFYAIYNAVGAAHKKDLADIYNRIFIDDMIHVEQNDGVDDGEIEKYLQKKLEQYGRKKEKWEKNYSTVESRFKKDEIVSWVDGKKWRLGRVNDTFRYKGTIWLVIETLDYIYYDEGESRVVFKTDREIYSYQSFRYIFMNGNKMKAIKVGMIYGIENKMVRILMEPIPGKYLVEFLGWKNIENKVVEGGELVPFDNRKHFPRMLSGRGSKYDGRKFYGI
jgi:hypothetical protein